MADTDTSAKVIQRTPSQDTTASGHVEPLHISRKVSLQLRALRVDDDSPVCDVIIKTSHSSGTKLDSHSDTITETSTDAATSASTGTESSQGGAVSADLDNLDNLDGEPLADDTELRETDRKGSATIEQVCQDKTTRQSVDGDDVNECRECREDGLDECQCDTGSVDLDLSDVDPDVADCLIRLNKATETVDEIEHDLYKCKDRLLEIINKGDVTLRNVENRLGMLKAIDRAKIYYKQEQRAVDAKDAAEMADMQLQKVVNAYEKARTEQHLCEKQLEKELVGSLAKGGQSKGVSVVIDLQVQDALNNAAMCVQECKMELQRVDGEVKLAYRKAKKEIELCESIRITDRGSIDKAQIYYDTRDKVLSKIDAVQRELDRKVAEDSRARLKVAQCLQALQNMSNKQRADLSSPTPTSAVEELVTSGLSRMSFSSQRSSQPHGHSLPTHHTHSTLEKASPTVVSYPISHQTSETRSGHSVEDSTTTSQTNTPKPSYLQSTPSFNENGSHRELGVEGAFITHASPRGGGMYLPEESEEDIDITDSPSLLGRVAPGATSPSYSSRSYSHFARI